MRIARENTGISEVLHLHFWYNICNLTPIMSSFPCSHAIFFLFVVFFIGYGYL